MLAAALSSLVLLHGTVTVGPTSPVCRAGTQCSKPATHGEITFTRSNRLAMAVIDSKGHYRVRLAPGYWNVDVSLGMGTAPRRIYVPRVASATRNFTVVTGIR